MTCDDPDTTGISQSRSRHCEGLKCLETGEISYDTDASNPYYQGTVAECQSHNDFISDGHGGCYVFYQTPETFYDARQKCLCRGGDIAMFTSSMEYEALANSNWFMNTSCKKCFQS